MRIANPTPLQFGWIVGKIKPPQWTATFMVKGTFSLRPAAPLDWAEEPRHLSGDIYVDDDPTKELLYASDFAPMKPRADVLVRANACAPGGVATSSIPVSIRVGTWAKELMVYGERQWKRNLIGLTSLGEPKPFVTQPIGYSQAFGAPGHAKNPIGIGRKSDRAPVVEDPKQPVRSPSDNVDPAGFGPIPPSWPSRSSLIGTYGNDWLKTRWPWFPADFDWAYFNAAPPDMQVAGFLAGDEAIEFRNLHPSAPLLQSKLPGIRPRCFVADLGPNGEDRFREVALQLDTFWADLTTDTLVLVWRGQLEVQTIKLKEVDSILLAAESMAESPKPPEAYRSALATATLDEATESELPPAPASTAEFDSQLAEMDKEFAAFEKEMAEMQAQVVADVEKQKAALIASGVDPKLFAQAPPEASIVAEIDKLLVDLRASDPATAAKVELHRPWLAKAEREMTALDAEMDQMERDMEKQRAEIEALRPKRWTREGVIKAAGEGKSFAGENLTDLDLSKLTFTQCDFRGAVLAKANLSECRLDAADLRECNLSGANLSKADLQVAHLDGADLTGSNLADAKLVGVSLRGTTLGGLDLNRVDLTGCDAVQADFSSAKLEWAIFDQANVSQADFTGAKLENARFVGATMKAAQFDSTRAAGINCENADLTGLHGSGADFSGARFRRARAANAVFAESVLDGADFSGAILSRAQFGDASLRGAKLDLVDAAGAMFDDAVLTKASATRANLLRVSLDRANLTETEFRGSNLFEAGFWDAVVVKTNFRDANLAGTMQRR